MRCVEGCAGVIKRVVADWPLVLIALLLSVYGIAMVYSAGQTEVAVRLRHGRLEAQLVWFGVGVIGAFVD